MARTSCSRQRLDSVLMAKSQRMGAPQMRKSCIVFTALTASSAPAKKMYAPWVSWNSRMPEQMRSERVSSGCRWLIPAHDVPSRGPILANAWRKSVLLTAGSRPPTHTTRNGVPYTNEDEHSTVGQSGSRRTLANLTRSSRFSRRIRTSPGLQSRAVRAHDVFIKLTKPVTRGDFQRVAGDKYAGRLSHRKCLSVGRPPADQTGRILRKFPAREAKINRRETSRAGGVQQRTSTDGGDCHVPILKTGNRS